MSTSPASLSKWQRQYAVLKHPVLGHKVIRLDCLPLCVFFGPLGLLMKKLWLKGLGFTALVLCLGLMLPTMMDVGWSFTLIAFINMFIAFKGGKWLLADMTKSRGYELVLKCNAKLGEQALALVGQKLGSPSIAVAAIVIMSLSVVASHAQVRDTRKIIPMPPCDSEQAKNMAREAFAARGDELKDIMHIQNENSEDEGAARAMMFCRGLAVTDKGNINLGYAYRPNIEDKGTWLVQIINIDRDLELTPKN